MDVDTFLARSHLNDGALACILEATARKPGNVHPHRGFDDSHYLDFVLSALLLDPLLNPAAIRTLGVGLAVRNAVADAVAVVGHNANLGMALLLVPLAADRDRDDPRAAVGRVLRSLTVEDAESVYEAIRLARPGGLGTATEQDVSRRPTVTLLEAMRLAADRDAVARQYATDYADVFGPALPALGAAIAAGRPTELAIIHAHLVLMAERPDTLILRKCGPEVAAESARRAADVLGAGWPDAPGSVDELRAFDAWLRGDGRRRNPGATADLIAATLSVALRIGTIDPLRDLRRDAWDGGDAL